MKEFMYCFQISKLIVFEVEYYTLGGNKAPYFSTSAIIADADRHSGSCCRSTPRRADSLKNGIIATCTI